MSKSRNAAVRAFVLAIVLAGAAASRAGAQWIEAGSAHYTVFYQAGYEKDAEFTRTWLDRTEQLMKTKYGATPDRYHMSIYLLPAPAGDIDTVQSGQNVCCTRTATGVSTGTIKLLALSAPVWKAANLTSSLGLPKAGEDYHHARLLRNHAGTFEAAFASETRPYALPALFDRFRKWLEAAPEVYRVRLDTSKGVIVIDVHRDWAPNGADRFHELVTSGYYDDAAVFRIRKGTWAQFGIAADPRVAQAWRTKTIPDDPFKGVSNKRGTVAFAFKDPGGRTTQVFINLKDNSETHDKEPFVVFGEVVEGMDVADALYAEYGEAAGGGIRGGKQDPVFEGGSAYLKEKFPLLDYIKTARVVPPPPAEPGRPRHAR